MTIDHDLVDHPKSDVEDSRTKKWNNFVQRAKYQSFTLIVSGEKISRAETQFKYSTHLHKHY